MIRERERERERKKKEQCRLKAIKALRENACLKVNKICNDIYQFHNKKAVLLWVQNRAFVERQVAATWLKNVWYGTFLERQPNFQQLSLECRDEVIVDWQHLCHQKFMLSWLLLSTLLSSVSLSTSLASVSHFFQFSFSIPFFAAKEDLTLKPRLRDSRSEKFKMSFLFQLPDIGSELTGGCYGFATRYMHWPEQLIVGGTTKNKTGHITRFVYSNNLFLNRTC